MADYVLTQNVACLGCLGLYGRVCAFVELGVKNTWSEQEWCFSVSPNNTRPPEAER